MRHGVREYLFIEAQVAHHGCRKVGHIALAEIREGQFLQAVGYVDAQVGTLVIHIVVKAYIIPPCHNKHHQQHYHDDDDIVREGQLRRCGNALQLTQILKQEHKPYHGRKHFGQIQDGMRENGFLQVLRPLIRHGVSLFEKILHLIMILFLTSSLRSSRFLCALCGHFQSFQPQWTLFHFNSNFSSPSIPSTGHCPLSYR